MNPTSLRIADGDVTLRPAQTADAEAIVGLIGELAEFEALSHLLAVTPQALRQHLFGPQPAAQALVAELLPAAGGPSQVVAFALWFTNFSTFLGRPGLYLEDLYVRPAHRGQGLGRRMLRQLARLAVERGCGRFEWSVLDWNADAIRFYESMGARVMPDWRICRLAGEALIACAEPEAPAPAAT
ncbi:MAG: GNAT family N-acetyltransferase [Burkholderiaceae bacterium]|nr:GNAT family N-acetyltransferase [Burkholderiaceae bacterium]